MTSKTRKRGIRLKPEAGKMIKAQIKAKFKTQRNFCDTIKHISEKTISNILNSANYPNRAFDFTTIELVAKKLELEIKYIVQEFEPTNEEKVISKILDTAITLLKNDESVQNITFIKVVEKAGIHPFEALSIYSSSEDRTHTLLIDLAKKILQSVAEKAYVTYSPHISIEEAFEKAIEGYQKTIQEYPFILRLSALLEDRQKGVLQEISQKNQRDVIKKLSEGYQGYLGKELPAIENIPNNKEPLNINEKTTLVSLSLFGAVVAAHWWESLGVGVQMPASTIRHVALEGLRPPTRDRIENIFEHLTQEEQYEVIQSLQSKFQNNKRCF